MTVLADLVQTLVNGILQGGVYAAAAVGLSLIFGVSGILNAAHGELVMLGAFATYWLFTLYHLDPLLTLPISFALLGALGWLLQYFVLNRTLGKPLLLSLLVTFGISLILVNAALRLWTGDFRMMRVPYLDRSLIIGPFIVPLARLVACVAGIAMVSGLTWLLASTRPGRMIRATAQDWEMARLLGVNPRKVYALTFGARRRDLGHGRLSGRALHSGRAQHGADLYPLRLRRGRARRPRLHRRRRSGAGWRSASPRRSPRRISRRGCRSSWRSCSCM